MNEINEPPTALIQDAGMSDIQRDAIIEKWRQYLQKQSVIKVFDGEKLAGYDPGVEFAVHFPKSSMHVHDFKEGIMSATAEARFFGNGNVEIEGIEHDIVRKNFDQAWSEVYRRCTGKDLEFLLTAKLPEEAIVEDLEKKVETFLEKLEAWKIAFKKIPVVFDLEILEDNEYGNLMEIRLFTNGSFMLNREGCEAIDDYKLRSTGFVEYANYSQGESDLVYEKWVDKNSDRKEEESLPEFYQAVLDLNDRYLNAVPDAPVGN